MIGVSFLNFFLKIG